MRQRISGFSAFNRFSPTFGERSSSCHQEFLRLKIFVIEYRYKIFMNYW